MTLLPAIPFFGRAADVSDLERAVEEVCLNVVEHGFEPGQAASFDVALLRRPGHVVVAVEDRGLPYDFADLEAPEARDLAAIAASQRKTSQVLGIFDSALARQPYAAGPNFSMGDVPLGVMVYRFYHLVPEPPKFPNLARWYASIASRPAFVEHVSSIPLQ